MRPFKHVLAAVDLSARSRHTAFHAVEIAQACGAHLSLVHVHPFFPSETGPSLSHREQAALLLSLSDLAEDVGGHRPPPSSLLEGDPAAEIVRHADSHSADLIVIGSRRRGPMQRLFSTSVAHRVCADARCSVLAVPEAAEEARRPPADSAEVLCAVGLDGTSPHTTNVAVALAARTKTRLTLLHVMERAEPTAQDRLASLVRDHPFVNTRLATGPTPETIAHEVASRRAGLLVVGAHSGRALGQTAQWMIANALCPVLLVRVAAAVSGATAGTREVAART